ncbi:MAG: LysR substrate-binding domain-containing protein, partial [Pseudomonadota bacterium]|nr:LysR substrate-binding domain-containing protein [Pseudomonadota bacterium]
DAEWVLPYKGAPSRKAFEQVMHAAGLPLPKNAIESNALVALRALLIESDRLSILSRNQIHYEELHGMLSVLPIDMRGSERPIGITTRADAKRSIGLDALLRHLRAVSDEMKESQR